MFPTILALVPDPIPGADSTGWFLTTLQWAADQFHNHNYLPAVGAAIMVLVALFHKLFDAKISKTWAPWVSAALGVALSCAAHLAMLMGGYTKSDWVGALANGFIAGLSASGLYSLVGKWLMTKLGLNSSDSTPVNTPTP